MRLISFNSLSDTSFCSPFVRKSVFYSKDIQYANNFYETDLYVNVWRNIFRTLPNIYCGTSLQKSQESLTVGVRLGSKYASSIGFTVGKVYRMLIFTWYGESRFKKFAIAFLFLNLIKKHVRLTVSWRRSLS